MKQWLLFGLVSLCLAGWPTVKFPEHRALPQLEVRVAPPDEYQPEVQAEIKRLDAKREDTEFKYIKALEDAYNEELGKAGKSIKSVVKKAAKMFDNPQILKASIQYAIGAVAKDKKNARFLEADNNQFQQSRFIEQQHQNQQQDQQLSQQQEQQLNNQYRDNQQVEYQLIDEEIQKEYRNGTNQLQQTDQTNQQIDKELGQNNQQRFIENDKNKEIDNEIRNNKLDGPINSQSDQKVQQKDRQQYSIQNGPIVNDQVEQQKQSQDDQVGSKGKNNIKQYDIQNGPIKMDDTNKSDSQQMDLDQKQKNTDMQEYGIKNGPISKEVQESRDSLVQNQAIQNQVKESGSDLVQNGVVQRQIERNKSDIQNGPLDQQKVKDIGQKQDGDMERLKSKGQKEIKDGPLDIKQDEELKYSFLQLNEKIGSGSKNEEKEQAKEPEPLPPVMVKMFKSEKPDAAIQGDMDKLETQRNDIEKKMFKKAEAELELITKQTLQELEANIETEMMPFYAVKDNTLQDVQSAIQGAGLVRFREQNEEEFDQTFPLISQQIKKKQQQVNRIGEEIRKEQQSFLELSSKLKEKLKGQVKAKAEADNINVRLAAYENPYPTIFRLVNEMESRRDLAERFERLKILEYEMNLQKNEDEMIKDALHSSLALVMATYGPAIEGVQENLRTV